MMTKINKKYIEIMSSYGRDINKNKDEALLYLIKRLEETENELNDLREINLSLRNETVSQEIKLSEVRDFIKKHRRTIDDYYIYDPADSQELKELSDVIY